MEIQEVEGADDLQPPDQDLFQLPGFNFKPNDVDLVAFYLRSRISGGMFPSNLIRDLDIYSTEPWHLPGGLFQSQSEEKYMLFFTRRHPISARSRKFNRTAGCGLWHCSSKDKNVKHGSQVIGYRLQFTFKKIDSGKQKIHTNWIMHEFRLNKTTNIDSLVLCKIFKRKHGEEGDTDGLGAGIAFSDVSDGEEENEGRLAKRRRIVESGGQKGLMADYAETSSKNASSSLSSSSLPHEAPSVAVEKPIQHQEETGTYERLEKRRQVEKHIQQEAIMADNNEKRYCRVDNTKATNQPSVFKDEFATLEDLICLDDFPQWTTEFNASPLMGDCDETFLPYEEQTATEERLEMRKQVEEPDQQQGILAHYNEDTTEANSQSSLFNAVYEYLFVDDSSPQDAEINASSSFFPCSDDIQNLGWAGLYHTLMN